MNSGGDSGRSETVGSSEGGGEATALSSSSEGREGDHTAMAWGQTKTGALVPLTVRMSSREGDEKKNLSRVGGSHRESLIQRSRADIVSSSKTKY